MAFQFTICKQKYEKGLEKSFKIVQLPLPKYLSTTKYMLKNQPNICDKISTTFCRKFASILSVFTNGSEILPYERIIMIIN